MLKVLSDYLKCFCYHSRRPKNDEGIFMIYLNDKLRGAPSHKFLPVSALNLILMSLVKPTATEQIECTDVAKQSLLTLGRELGEKAVTRFKGMTAATLATLALSTAACAQDAPVQHAEFTKGSVATTPAKATSAALDTTSDVFDIDALMAASETENEAAAKRLAAEKAETAAEKAETARLTEEAAQKTEEAAAIQRLVAIGKTPTK